MVGVTIDAADKSGAENIREVAWVQQQVKAELNDLKNDVSVDKFYETEADGSIKYKMDLVKDYLNTLKDKEWNQLIQKNTSAWMMAVQIALEKL
ncbi:hypothetical protein J6T66_02625 [bacterium]|nr:hypothetical protein [bacterium]